jgi:DNA (cytosine-5)-methyltransferase 1
MRKLPYYRKDVSAVDLFCGAGGLTYGFNKEGIHVTAGIDIDPSCFFPYTNNNDSTFIHRDVSEIEATEVEDLFIPNTIWILAGCAPCQPFSTYSRRYDTISDRKWGLLYEFKRIVSHVIPDIVTMENVPEIRKQKVFRDFVESLLEIGYEVWYNVIDCGAYGVPQSRKRIVLLASMHGPIRMMRPLLATGNYKTVEQSIRWLNPLEAGESDPKDRLHVASKLSETNLARIRASEPGRTWRDWPRDLRANCHQIDTGRTYASVYGRMVWGAVAPTITTQCYGFGNGRFGHPEQDRAISLREAAILQGFPSDYEFVPPDEQVRIKTVGRLIGNAVPPPLGRAIAKSILDHIHERKVKPRKPSSLADKRVSVSR